MNVLVSAHLFAMYLNERHFNIRAGFDSGFVAFFGPTCENEHGLNPS